MSLDTAETVKSIVDSILLKPIGRAMANPLTLAVMITFVVMIIVMYTYDDRHKLRTLLYVFGTCTFFLFMNNHVLIADMTSRQLSPDQQNVLRSVELGAQLGGPMIVRRPLAVSGGTLPGGDHDNSDVLEELEDASSMIVPA